LDFALCYGDSINKNPDPQAFFSSTATNLERERERESSCLVNPTTLGLSLEPYAS